jgi:hypothetical protein
MPNGPPEAGGPFSEDAADAGKAAARLSENIAVAA